MTRKSQLQLNSLPAENTNLAMFRIAGNLDIFSGQELRKALDKQTENPDVSTVILETTDLDYIDSSGIGIMFSNGIKLKKRGGSLILIKPKDMVIQALTMTRALSQMKICETIDEALAEPISGR